MQQSPKRAPTKPLTKLQNGKDPTGQKSFSSPQKAPHLALRPKALKKGSNLPKPPSVSCPASFGKLASLPPRPCLSPKLCCSHPISQAPAVRPPAKCPGNPCCRHPISQAPAVRPPATCPGDPRMASPLRPLQSLWCYQGRSAQLAQTKLLLGLWSYLNSPGRNARLAIAGAGPMVLPGPKRKSGAGQQAARKSKPKRRATAWNKGRKHSKTNKQHVFVPREQLQLFFAVALFFAGPAYCAVLWIALVTSRRTGETLLLKGTDVRLRGGEDHDAPRILFERGEGDQGNGKLPEERVVARLSQEAVDGLTRMKTEGLERQCLPALEPYRKTHPKVFQNKRGGGLTALRQETFAPDWESEDHVFPSKTKKPGRRPTMARQTVWAALHRVRQVMYELTNHERRWNPTVRCQGNRVTVHGATRHTSAALLLFNSDKLLQSAKPSQQVIR